MVALAIGRVFGADAAFGATPFLVIGYALTRSIFKRVKQRTGVDDEVHCHSEEVEVVQHCTLEGGEPYPAVTYEESEKRPPYPKRERALKWVDEYALTFYNCASTAMVAAAVTSAIPSETTMALHIGRIYRGEQFSSEEAAVVANLIRLRIGESLSAKIAKKQRFRLPIIAWNMGGAVYFVVIKNFGAVMVDHFESTEKSS